MAIPADIANALRGAWRLARFDPSGVAFFGHDERAFWRSFIAALIAFPAFLLFLPLGSDADAAPTDWVRVLLVETIAYVIGWTAFPPRLLCSTGRGAPLCQSRRSRDRGNCYAAQTRPGRDLSIRLPGRK